MILGGLAEALARRRGFSRIESVAQSVGNARKLAQPIHIYLAGARNMDDSTAERWQTACNAMEQDGTQARILARYR